MSKPAELEKLQGNPGHRLVNKNAPVPEMVIPKAPKFLDKVATRKYYDLARVAGPEGIRVAGKSDGETLAMTAFAYSRFRAALKILGEKTEYYTTPSGQIKKHPAMGEVSDWWVKYNFGLSKLGLNPYERQKVSAFPEEEKGESREDKMAEFRKKALEAAKKQSHRQQNIGVNQPAPFPQKVEAAIL